MSLLPKKHIGTGMSRLLKRAYAVEAIGALWTRENSFRASSS